MDPTKEKAVGCVLAGGFVLAVASGILAWVFTMGGVFRGTYTRTPITNHINDAGTLNLLPLMVTLIAIGVAMMLGAVTYGLLYSKMEATGTRRKIEDALILSRYAVSKSGNILSDWELEGTDDARFYVRMMVPGGRPAEYPVAAETYFNCAEGAAGEAEMQGRWIGRFTPYVGPRV